jgi:hypothetical protein
MVNRLTKEAAVEDGPVIYDKIPREANITRDIKWTAYVTRALDEQGEGSSDKNFSPSVGNRLRGKIPIFP